MVVMVVDPGSWMDMVPNHGWSGLWSWFRNMDGGHGCGSRVMDGHGSKSWMVRVVVMVPEHGWWSWLWIQGHGWTWFQIMDGQGCGHGSGTWMVVMVVDPGSWMVMVPNHG